MNINVNKSVQNTPQKPTAAPTTAQALAQQLKTEGEAEAARGAELQKDGVELQGQAATEAEQAAQLKEMGQKLKAQGAGHVQAGSAQVQEGQAEVGKGIESEKAARQTEGGHVANFVLGVVDGLEARQQANEAVEVIQQGLASESAAHQAEKEQIGAFGEGLKEAGVRRLETALTRHQAEVAVGQEKLASEDVDGGTVLLKQGITAQGNGRRIAGDGRNSLRVADDLQAQSETATNRSKAYADTADGHFAESENLKEEAGVHAETSSVFALQSQLADSMGIVAGAEGANQNSVAALLAAKAAIDSAAANSLSGLSHFSAEAETTRLQSELAKTQSVLFSERGEFYGSLAGALGTEAQALTGRSQIESQNGARKEGLADNLVVLGTENAELAEKFAGDAESKATQSAQVKADGEKKLAYGNELQEAGRATLEAALGQLSKGIEGQTEAHNAQTTAQQKLVDLNTKSAAGLEAREQNLAGIQESGVQQVESLLQQAAGLISLIDASAQGAEHLATREEAAAGLVESGQAISEGIGAQVGGFVKRTVGSQLEEQGAKEIRDGEESVRTADGQSAEAARKLETGVQKEEAGKVVAEKGRQYTELAKQAAAAKA